MAGDWIKMRTHLGAERATMVICDLTGLDEFAVVGRLHAIWVWAGEHTVTGDVTGVTLKTIDRVTRCEKFGDAMVAAGWLETLPDGGVKFPRWRLHNSKAAKARALANERQARKRQKTRDSQRDSQRDASGTSHASREEKRREEKNNKPLPLCLQTDDFEAAWKAWHAHRTELKKPLRPTMEAAQIAMLEKLGCVRAVAMIRHTIAMGWQGLREPETGKPQPAPYVPVRAPEVPHRIPKVKT